MIIPPKELIELFKSTNGAFSVTEMFALYNIILDAPKGVYCELGVAHGKSALIMVAAMSGSEIVLVEPDFSDEKRLAEVVSVIQKATDKKLHCLPIAGYSTDVLPGFKEVAYIMVDSGSHQDGLPLAEVKLLEDKLVSGGIIAFHDMNSQFKEVREAYQYLISTGKYSEIEINWQEIIEAVNENNWEESNQSWHHNELKNPCFLGALRRK